MPTVKLSRPPRPGDPVRVTIDAVYRKNLGRGGSHVSTNVGNHLLVMPAGAEIGFEVFGPAITVGLVTPDPEVIDELPAGTVVTNLHGIRFFLLPHGRSVNDRGYLLNRSRITLPITVEHLPAKADVEENPFS